MRLAGMVVLMAAAVAGAAPESSVQAPVTSVTLYTSGATYLEHQGTVRGDATIELTFKSSQISGVLKSLMVQDGSRATAAVHPLEPSTQPADGRRIELKKDATLADLVEKLRGSRVRLACGGEVLEGTLLSLEKKEKVTDRGTTEIVQLNLLSNGGLRSVLLENVLRVELSDPRMQEELNRAVEATWQEAGQDRKTVNVPLLGKEERSVRVSYALEAQPWKVNYRLVLSDKPTLQVWASVYNETDLDWNHVRLNLMSGRPLAQTQELLVDADAAKNASSGMGVPVGQPMRRPKAYASRDAIDGVETMSRPESSGPLVNAREAFRYSVDGVTIPRQSRTVVPVSSEAVKVERVSVYNESVLKKNPLQGVRLFNTTKRYLFDGPVTVVDEGNFVGDATISNVAPGRFGVLTWGIDLAVLVDATDVTYFTEVAGGRIEAGALQMDRRHTYAKQYTFENDDQQDRDLIIEHPIRRGYVLVEPKTAMEKTDKVYRIRMTAPAGKRSQLLVKEQTLEEEAIDLATADAETLRALSRTTELAEAVRTALTKAAALRGQMDDIQRQTQQKRIEIGRLTRDQARLRENLETADNADAKAKLTAALQQRDAQIEELHKAIDQAQEQSEKASQEFEAYVSGLKVG